MRRRVDLRELIEEAAVAAASQLMAEKRVAFSMQLPAGRAAGDRGPRPAGAGDAEPAVERGEVLRSRLGPRVDYALEQTWPRCASTCADNGARRAAQRTSDIIFEKFRQVGDTLTGKPHGTGLGLPISREIVRHFGGRLWVRRRARAAARSFRSRSRSRRHERSRALQRRSSSRTTSRTSSSRSSTCSSATATACWWRATVDEALEAVARYLPDLVLLDVMLPVVDGFEVCETIRAAPALAARACDHADRQGARGRVRKGLALGADAYLTKPFSTKELLAEIACLLG